MSFMLDGNTMECPKCGFMTCARIHAPEYDYFQCIQCKYVWPSVEEEKEDWNIFKE